jgi:DNA-binding protein WhiA
LNITASIKNQILETRFIRTCCQNAFLSGVARGAGRLALASDGFGLVIQHASPHLIDKCANLITKITGEEPQIIKKNKDESFGQREVFELSLAGPNATKLLMASALIDSEYSFSERPLNDFLKLDCCKKSYIKGLFAASGNLLISEEYDDDDARSTGYLLEIFLGDTRIAESVKTLLTDAGVPIKLRQKSGRTILYLKDSQAICDFCAYVESSDGYFALQNVIVARNCKNNITRKVNWEMANMDRSQSASQKQLDAILKIEQTIGLKNIPYPLQDVAIARRNNPALSIPELLLKIPNPPSKSGLNHRMRKLIEIASTLEDAPDK